MGKIRVHELAKKLGLSNQEVLDKLKSVGVSAKTHSSNIDEAVAVRELNKNLKDAEATAKPRTMLRRRRRPENESAAPQEVPAETPEKLPVVEEKPAVQAAPPSVAVVAEVPTPITVPVVEKVSEAEVHEAAVVASPQVEKPEAKAVEAASELPEKPAVVATEVSASAEADASKAEGPKRSTNVVRVINADAIKARLAAEGRTFRPRAPRGATREVNVRRGRPGPGGPGGPRFGPGPGGPPRTGPGGPGPGAGPTAPAGGARPSKKGGKKGQTYGQQSQMRREMRSGGGYELWVESAHKKKRRANQEPVNEMAARKKVVELSGPITVNDLAHQMSIKAGQVVGKLMGMGMMVTVNQSIDPDTATIVAEEFGYEVKNVAFEESDLLVVEKEDESAMVARAPVVTVMGHVDHGKTSLLDAIRSARVAAGEAGGITQHIGAHYVTTSRGAVTFLDTPGHKAFTSMRARGAQMTDMVVLVVAANDGVMPQTIEAIDHAKAAKVPLIVAVNKMDLPDANPDKVMQQLAEREVVAEEWGGDVQFFKVSALKGEGLDDLLDGLVTLAEVMELKANPDRLAEGTVVEAKLDRGRGPVATALVHSGTLKTGDHFVAGVHAGRVRAMYDSTGKKVDVAGPSFPVQILGLPSVPNAGDSFNAVKDDKTAKTISEHRTAQSREQELLKSSAVSLENFMASSPSDAEVHSLKLIVKADVYGSVEALKTALIGLSTAKVKVEIVHSGVGTITENDVNLALAGSAIIIGFNIKPDGKAQELAMQEKVDCRYYQVIYEALDEVKTAMAGMLSPVIEENELGRLEVRTIFSVGKTTKIAGSYVLEGLVKRAARVRVLRNKKPIGVGNISGLKRFKDDVKEVKSGYECGLMIEGFNDLQEGDIVQCFQETEVAAVLDEAVIDKKPEPVVVEGAESASEVQPGM